MRPAAAPRDRAAARAPPRPRRASDPSIRPPKIPERERRARSGPRARSSPRSARSRHAAARPEAGAGSPRRLPIAPPGRPRPSRRCRPAAASAGSSSTTSISWRIAVAAAISSPAAIGYPPAPASRRARTARQASATTGTRTQLSWATTPEKKIWPGHSARARPAAMRQRTSRIGRQSRNGRSGVSPVTTAVATRAACSVPWGTTRKSTDSSSGNPELNCTQCHPGTKSPSSRRRSPNATRPPKSENGRAGKAAQKARRTPTPRTNRRAAPWRSRRRPAVTEPFSARAGARATRRPRP